MFTVFLLSKILDLLGDGVTGFPAVNSLTMLLDFFSIWFLTVSFVIWLFTLVLVLHGLFLGSGGATEVASVRSY